METMALAEANDRLSELIATVTGAWKRVVITKNGRPAAVLLSYEDLDTLLETPDVLSDPEAMQTIRETRAGTGERTTDEQMAALMAERFGRGAV